MLWNHYNDNQTHNHNHRRVDTLGALTWKGVFSQAVRGLTLGAMPSSAVDRSNGGPVAVFDETNNSYKTLIVSPFDHFLASQQYTHAASSQFICNISADR